MQGPHVREELGVDIPVIDGGPCEVGLESTVLGVTEDAKSAKLVLLRPGAISAQEIEKTLRAAGIAVQWNQTENRQQAPGQMKHHYMPAVPLVYVRSRDLSLAVLREQIRKQFEHLPQEVEGVRMVRPGNMLNHLETLKLSSTPALAAREFYASLRDLAAKKPDLILFYEEPVHRSEPWQALLDRLTKAASLVV